MRKRLDKRYTVIPVILVITALMGLTLHFSKPTGEPVVLQDDPGLHLLHQQFQQAVALLQHGEFDYAVQGFHEVLKVSQRRRTHVVAFSAAGPLVDLGVERKALVYREPPSDVLRLPILMSSPIV